MYVYIYPDGTVTLTSQESRNLLELSELAFKTTIIDEGLDLIKFENLKHRDGKLIKTFNIPIIDLV
jgi:hypothetical protein